MLFAQGAANPAPALQEPALVEGTDWGFAIEGRLVAKYFHRDGSILAERTRNFNATIHGCDWRIVITPEPISEKEQIIEWDIASAGGTLYYVARFNPATRSTRASNDSVSMIEFQTVPQDYLTSYIPQVWLAFASECYLGTITNNLAQPVYHMAPDALRDAHHVVPVKVEMLGAGQTLPREVSYFTDGVMRDFQGLTRPASPPYDSGYLRARYVTLGTSNVVGSEIPTRFEYAEYRMAPDAKRATDLVPYRRCEGTVAVVKKVDRTHAVIPSAAGVSLVGDHRVRTLDPRVRSVSYLTTNGNWPELHSLIVQEAFASVKIATVRELDRATAEAARLKLRRLQVGVIVFGLVAVTTMLYIHRLGNRSA